MDTRTMLRIFRTLSIFLLVVGLWVSQSVQAQDEPKKTVAFVTNQIASFWNIAEVGCQDAAEDFDINVDVRFPDEATATQQKQIVEDLLASGIDALAITPLDAENQQQAINNWCNKIPVITHDSDAPETERLMYIGMDNYLAGRLLGKLIKDEYPDGCNLIISVGRLEQDNSRKRRQGVIDELLGREPDATRFDEIDDEIEGNGFTIYATITDQGKPEVAKQKVEDAINAYDDVELFVGLFAYNPPACLQGIRQSNMVGKIKVAAFDEADQTLQGIKEGSVIGTVVQDPYEYGYQSVRILSELLKGNNEVIPESKFIDIVARAVTKTERDIDGTESLNVDDFWSDLRDKTGQ